MKKMPTPKELLELIQKNLFMDVDLTCVLKMTSAELTTFTLEQMERLLSIQNKDCAAWLSDLFWTADKELTLMDEPHPWMKNEYEIYEHEALSDLSDDEYEIAVWILKLTALAHALVVHTPFPLDILEDGLENAVKHFSEQFNYRNKRLIDWIRTSPYRHIAALVCYIVLDTETNWAIRSNQAVQDFYAMDCWDSGMNWRSLERCEAFIQKALNGMQQIEEHYEKGHKAGLNDEEIRVLDAIYGFAPHDYFDEDFACVRDICKAANDHLPSKPYIKSEKGQREYGKAVFDDLKDIFTKYDMPFDPSDLTDLTPGYLDAWIYDKYYE